MTTIDRREFLKLVGAGSIGVGAGYMLAESIKHPVEHLIPAVIPPEDYSPGVVTWYHTVCAMCDAGCGIAVRIREGRAKKIEGNPSHPVNQGRLCALGQAGLQTLYNPDRLTEPLARSNGSGGKADSAAQWQPVTWEQGLAGLAERLQALAAGGQARRVALLSRGARGHLTVLFEQFMAQLGSERLLYYDFAHPHALYAANRRFFGTEALPYYDLKNTRYLLSFGADYLGSWLSPVHHSLGFGYSRQGHGDFRGHFVQIEPRMSLSGAAADEWLPARPGSEGIAALALAHHIVRRRLYRGSDRDEWAEVLQPYAPERVAAQTDIPEATLVRLAESLADRQPSLAIAGDSVAAHSNGVAALTAVNALNYLAGNLGRAGGLLFNPAPVVAQEPLPQARQANYRAMGELIEAASRGEIEVLIIRDTNPVFTLPEAARFREALARIPLVVSLSSFMDETTALADLILPSHTYLESWGDDFPEPGVGFPVGSVSQPVVSPLYNTRGTGDIILELARRLGFGEVLPWPDMKDYLKSAWHAIYERDARTADTEPFESFWHELLAAGVWGERRRPERVDVVPDKQVIRAIDVEDPVFDGDSETYPFVLQPYLSPALHDGRGANLPWLQELPDAMTSAVYGSWVEVNPATAARLGLAEGDLVSVESTHGSVQAPVCLYPAIRPDVVAMPIGQGHSSYGRYARDRGANPIAILAPELDPAAGSLAWGATRVRLLSTGKRQPLVKTSGTSRDLGRDIVQRVPGSEHTGGDPQLIPVKEV